MLGKGWPCQIFVCKIVKNASKFGSEIQKSSPSCVNVKCWLFAVLAGLVEEGAVPEVGLHHGAAAAHGQGGAELVLGQLAGGGDGQLGGGACKLGKK